MFCPYLKGTGIEAQGGHPEYMLMNADATYLIPDKVSYEQAAPIFCADQREVKWVRTQSQSIEGTRQSTRRMLSGIFRS